MLTQLTHEINIITYKCIYTYNFATLYISKCFWTWTKSSLKMQPSQKESRDKRETKTKTLTTKLKACIAKDVTRQLHSNVNMHEDKS